MSIKILVYILLSNCIAMSGGIWETNILQNVHLNNQYTRYLYHADDRIYALTSNGVFYSTNGGNFWSNILINAGDFQMNYSAETMTHIGEKIFVGAPYPGVYGSYDRGMNWIVLNSGLGSTNVVSVISNGSLLYAGTSDSGVYISSNYGSTWSASSSGLTNRNVKTLLAVGNNIFAGTSGGVFLSANNGVNWTSRNSGLTTLLIESLYSENGNLFAGTRDSGVYLSANGGLLWQKKSIGLPVNGMGVNSFTSLNNKLFAGTFGGGIFSSTNNGDNWFAVNNGFQPNPYVYSLLTNNTTVIAGMFAYPTGLYYSSNAGSNWQQFDAGLPPGDLYCVAGNDNKVYAGYTKYPITALYQTSNNGANWNYLSTLPTSEGGIRGLLFKPPYVFAAIRYGGIYRSPVSGLNWTQLGSIVYNINMNQILEKDGIIFSASPDSGIYKSFDDGVTWYKSNSGLPSTRIGALTVSGENLVTSSGGPIYYSTNNGNNWTLSYSKALNDRIVCLYSIGTRTYSASPYTGLFYSTDSGVSWDSVNTGFTDLDFSISSEMSNFYLHIADLVIFIYLLIKETAGLVTTMVFFRLRLFTMFTWMTNTCLHLLHRGCIG